MVPKEAGQGVVRLLRPLPLGPSAGTDGALETRVGSPLRTWVLSRGTPPTRPDSSGTPMSTHRTSTSSATSDLRTPTPSTPSL